MKYIVFITVFLFYFIAQAAETNSSKQEGGWEFLNKWMLIEYASEGNLDGVRELIEEYDVDPNYVPDNGTYAGLTALNEALKNNHYEIAKYLITKISNNTREQFPILCFAVRGTNSGNTDYNDFALAVLEEHIQEKIEPYLCNEYYMTDTWAYLPQNNIDKGLTDAMVRWYGGDINKALQKYSETMMRAFYSFSSEQLSYLVKEHNLNLNNKNMPFYFYDENLASDFNEQDHEYVFFYGNASLLMLALLDNDIKKASYLICNGADINYETSIFSSNSKTEPFNKEFKIITSDLASKVNMDIEKIMKGCEDGNQ